ncbi:MAG TPA: hypothetical protein VFK94_04935, partial [Patescibacteria group bacterium]|nr:hypothetical protein [Patescibacteria group bacterium]
MKTIPCALLILVCWLSSAVYSQTNGNNSFRKFVKALPPVDKVEIIDVTPLVTDDVERTDCSRPGLVCAPDSFPYVMGNVKTLLGQDAYRISNQWRNLERDYLHNEDKCLVPDHILRFFKDDKVLLESQVCTLCRKITLPGMGAVSVAGSNEAPYYHFQNSLISDSSWSK